MDRHQAIALEQQHDDSEKVGCLIWPDDEALGRIVVDLELDERVTPWPAGCRHP